MNAAKIVMHVVQRDRGDVILDFLREGIRQTSEAAHLHTHGEILALYVAGADVLRIRIAKANGFLASCADGGAVAFLRFYSGFIAIVLNDLGEVDFIGK